MAPRRHGLLLLAALACATPVRADLVKLTSGGEIRGELDAQSKSQALAAQIKSPVVIRTLSGTTIIVPAENVQFVTRRPLVVEEYEVRQRRTPREVEPQWELAEWCRTRRLLEERVVHLEIILELDPDHAKAHLGLGHIQDEGEWTTLDAKMTAQGYVKHKGRYLLPQELELLEQSAEAREAQKAWFKKIRLWHDWLLGAKGEKSREAYRELQAIRDPHAVPALVRQFRNDPNENARDLYVDLLVKVQGDRAFEALVWQSLQDVSPALRRKSLDGIPEAGYQAALPYYIKALKDDANIIVQRAGEALQRMGDEHVIPYLIDALVTTHKYKVRVLVPEKSIGATGSGVSLGGAQPITLPPEIEGMLLTGQLPYGIQYSDDRPMRVKIVTIRHDHQNSQVLAALTGITGEDFGYDERTWKLWWLAKKK